MRESETRITRIGIAGGSGSGKTTLARALVDRLGSRATWLELDWYYRPLGHLSLEERQRVNFDAPGSLDLELFQEHLALLSVGEAVCPPQYCFRQHDRIGEREAHGPAEVVIAEGALLLAVPELLPHFDLRVWLEVEDSVRLERRRRRDQHERGRTRAEVERQWQRNVQPMYERYAPLSRSESHAVLSGHRAVELGVNDVLRELSRLRERGLG